MFSLFKPQYLSSTSFSSLFQWLWLRPGLSLEWSICYLPLLQTLDLAEKQELKLI